MAFFGVGKGILPHLVPLHLQLVFSPVLARQLCSWSIGGCTRARYPTDFHPMGCEIDHARTLSFQRIWAHGLYGLVPAARYTR
jgi:hypothetical protein